MIKTPFYNFNLSQDGRRITICILIEIRRCLKNIKIYNLLNEYG